jgi:hypothetical protein
MTRQQIEHVIPAAAATADVKEIVVIALVQHRFATAEIVRDRRERTPISPQQRELATARLNARSR